MDFNLPSIMDNDMDMSLSYFFRNGFQINQYFYNCTGVDSYAMGTKRPYLGTYFLVVGITLLAIYLPCLYVIARSDLMKSSCYKIMLFLGILDICCISTNSIATGYLGIIGATFCSYPRFIYVMGGIGCGCWMGSCCTCIVLAINRCCDINQSLGIRVIFLGKHVYFTLLIPFIYTIYAVFFTKVLCFHSSYMSWFFNPFIPNVDPLLYVNLAHTINNCVVSATTTCLYTYLCVFLIQKNRHAQSDSLTKTQRQIFVQSVLICSFNAIAAYIYVYMQFFYSPPEVILIGQLAWQCGHGSVCVVYITMNKTVRRGVIDLLPSYIREKAKIGSYSSTLARPMLSTVGMVDARTGAKVAASNSGTLF